MSDFDWPPHLLPDAPTIGGSETLAIAYDAQRGCKVAVKYALDDDPDGVRLLRREFRHGRLVRHPNVVLHHALMRGHGAHLLTMERVEGTHWPGDRAGAVGAAVFAGLAGDLIAAVSALHEAGLIHRDLKPANVLVTRWNRVVLVDLGFAAPPGDPLVMEAGNAAYRAPELSQGAEATYASDWYAVGRLLDAVAPGDAPAPWREAIDGMLSESPNDRRAPVHPLVRPARRAAPAADSAPIALEGRGAELDALHGCSDPRGTAFAFVRGESGIGKSALLARYEAEVVERSPGALVLSATCAPIALYPFALIDSLVEQLVTALLDDEGSSEWLHVCVGVVPGAATTARELWPALNQLPFVSLSDCSPRNVSHELPQGPASPTRRRRAAAELRVLLRHVVLHRPLVVVVDDVQWMPTSTLLALVEVFGSRDAANTVVAASREDAPASWPAVTEAVTIEPLSQPSSLRLLRDLAPDAAPREQALQRCGGHPFLLTQLARTERQAPAPARIPSRDCALTYSACPSTLGASGHGCGLPRPPCRCLSWPGCWRVEQTSASRA